MTKHLYVIRDTLAGQVVGGVLMFPGDPAAVRFFSDVCGDPQTTIHKHVADHELLCIGFLDESTSTMSIGEIGPRVVITGSALQASQNGAAS